MDITVGIAEDQQLFLGSLATLISSFDGYTVVVKALNGQELLKQLSLAAHQPDILLLDVNMPVMDGIATARAVTQQFPLIKIAALSIKDDDLTVLSMLRAGCCAYFLKDIHPDELERALGEMYAKGYYNGDQSNVNHRRLLLYAEKEAENALSEREKVFLRLASSDLTYKQIAAEMHLAERTIDGYRDSLFMKLSVQSRVGMVLEGLRRGIITL